MKPNSPCLASIITKTKNIPVIIIIHFKSFIKCPITILSSCAYSDQNSNPQHNYSTTACLCLFIPTLTLHLPRKVPTTFSTFTCPSSPSLPTRQHHPPIPHPSPPYLSTFSPPQSALHSHHPSLSTQNHPHPASEQVSKKRVRLNRLSPPNATSPAPKPATTREQACHQNLPNPRAGSSSLGMAKQPNHTSDQHTSLAILPLFFLSPPHAAPWPNRPEPARLHACMMEEGRRWLFGRAGFRHEGQHYRYFG